MLSFRIAVVGSVLLLGIAQTGSATAQVGLDPVPAYVQASQLLPGVPLQGPNYRIAPIAISDGALVTYDVTVKGQTYRIHGTEQLYSRLRELRALQQMDAKSRASTIGSAVKDGVTAPIKGAYNLVTKPVTTVSNFVSGVGSFFGNIGHAAVGRSNAEEESVLGAASGFGAARRAIAKGFGIDPYTSFPPVKERLSEHAWAAAGAGGAVGLGFSSISGTAGSLVSGLGSVQGMGNLVYDLSPADLKDRNEDTLERMGIRPELIRVLLNHPSFSPSHTTVIVAALAVIGAENTEAFLEKAVLTDNETSAFFMMRWAQMNALYHLNVNRIVRFHSLGNGFPIGLRADGVLVAAVPVDLLLWTEKNAWDHFNNVQTVKILPGITGGEVVLSGDIGRRALRSLKRRDGDQDQPGARDRAAIAIGTQNGIVHSSAGVYRAKERRTSPRTALMCRCISSISR